MTESTKNSERAKVLLIPVLGLVLLFVLLGGDEEAPAAAVELLTPTPSVITAAKVKTTDRQLERSQVQWPRESLVSITSHNPFELRDPRVLMDRAFAQAGIAESPIMTEISAEEFFPQPEEPPEQRGSWLRLLYSLADLPSHESGAQQPLRIRGQIRPGLALNPSRPPAVSAADPDDETAAKRNGHQLSRLEQRLAQLHTEPVNMIMKTRHGNSALLGSRRVTEGELFEEGIRISRIDRNGIRFEIIDNFLKNKSTPPDGGQ